jgi:hypothetical protein
VDRQKRTNCMDAPSAALRTNDACFHLRGCWRSADKRFLRSLSDLEFQRWTSHTRQYLYWIDCCHGDIRLRSRCTHRTSRAIVDSSDDAIVSKTLEGVITSWTTAPRNLWILEARHTFEEPVHSADRNRDQPEWQARQSNDQHLGGARKIGFQCLH